MISRAIITYLLNYTEDEICGCFDESAIRSSMSSKSFMYDVFGIKNVYLPITCRRVFPGLATELTIDGNLRGKIAYKRLVTQEHPASPGHKETQKRVACFDITRLIWPYYVILVRPDSHRYNQSIHQYTSKIHQYTSNRSRLLLNFPIQ